MKYLMPVHLLMLTPEGQNQEFVTLDNLQDEFCVVKLAYINPEMISIIETSIVREGFLYVMIGNEEKCIRGDIKEFRQQCEDFIANKFTINKN